jgi:hypothetical protein
MNQPPKFDDSYFSLLKMFLNPGAVIGALVGVACLVALLYTVEEGRVGRSKVQLGTILVILGFLGGGYLWGLVFDKHEEEPPKNS